MASLLERLAEELARDTLEQAQLSGDEDLVDAVAKSVGDTSTTFKEAYLTAVRYYRAEARARELLPDFSPQGGLSLPPPKKAKKPKPEPEPEVAEEDGIADAEFEDVAEEEEEEIPYAEAELVDEDGPEALPAPEQEPVPEHATEDEPQPGSGMHHSAPHVGTGRLVPTPSITPGVEVTPPRKRGE